jgi:hypothetical protein
VRGVVRELRLKHSADQHVLTPLELDKILCHQELLGQLLQRPTLSLKLEPRPAPGNSSLSSIATLSAPTL